MDEQPVLRVVRGDPSDEEIAALTAVLATAASPAPAAPSGPRSWWNDPAVRMRAPPQPGPGAWRASALPR